MDFEWDTDKARKNIEKHGISFFEACEVFDDDFSSAIQDPDHSNHEERLLLFGLTKNGKYVVVSFTECGESIRLISARQMTSRERKAYEQ